MQMPQQYGEPLWYNKGCIIVSYLNYYNIIDTLRDWQEEHNANILSVGSIEK